MSTAKTHYQIELPLIGVCEAVYIMGWKRTVVERVASLIALFGIMVMVAFLTMEGDNPAWASVMLGVSAMLSVLLIYGIPFESIKFGKLEIEFEDTE